MMHVAYYAVKGSRNIELACLKKKKERKSFCLFCEFPGSVLSQCFLVPLGVSLVMKTPEDEWYICIVIKAYKLTVFERFFWGIFMYCLSRLSLHTRTL